MAQLNFTSEGVERNNYEPLPAGEYMAMISESSFKHSKGFGGQPDTDKPPYLELGITIIDGDYKGRKVVDRLNLNHTNDLTRKIAKGTMAGILDALAMTTINDSSELHGKPMMVKLTIKPGEGQYGPSNNVSGYKPASAVSTLIPSVIGGGTAKKPWE